LALQPEQQARRKIDVLLEVAGWHVWDASAANIHAARGVAIREFPLPGYGFADYLLYVDGKGVGVIEATQARSPSDCCVVLSFSVLSVLIVCGERRKLQAKSVGECFQMSRFALPND
jgi:hypothetical protein